MKGATVGNIVVYIVADHVSFVTGQKDVMIDYEGYVLFRRNYSHCFCTFEASWFDISTYTIMVVD